MRVYIWSCCWCCVVARAQWKSPIDWFRFRHVSARVINGVALIEILIFMSHTRLLYNNIVHTHKFMRACVCASGDIRRPPINISYSCYYYFFYFTKWHILLLLRIYHGYPVYICGNTISHYIYISSERKQVRCIIIIFFLSLCSFAQSNGTRERRPETTCSV